MNGRLNTKSWGRKGSAQSQDADRISRLPFPVKRGPKTGGLVGINKER